MMKSSLPLGVHAAHEKSYLLLESLPLVKKVQTKSNHEGAVRNDRPLFRKVCSADRKIAALS